MDQVDDSGFDSDHKPSASLADMDSTSTHPLSEDFRPSSENEPMIGHVDDVAQLTGSSTPDVAFSKTLRKPTPLQKKIEKQRQASMRLHSSIQQQKTGVLSRSRLVVPVKSHSADNIGEASQPLVVIDESEDDFAVSSRLWRKSSAPMSDMVKQLANDGYNLDLQPDDSDLDLIPPRPLNERRCLCCYNGTVRSACVLQ